MIARDANNRLTYAGQMVPDGPWHTEPDDVEFEHVGLKCAIHRSSVGVLCGYVGVPPGHPWWGQRFDDIDANVHGGLTYARGNSVGPNTELWWLGFDCAHAGDLMPCMLTLSQPEFLRAAVALEYRNVDYVVAETQRLAEQAAAVARS
jgi:hypothetical protein